MSDSLMNRVLDSNLPRVEKTVLLAMVSLVPDDGRGYYASDARIVYKTGYDLSYIEKARQRLCAQGILVFSHQHPEYRVDVWDINLARIEPQAPFDKWYKAEWSRIRQKRSGQSGRTSQAMVGEIHNHPAQADARADLQPAHNSPAAGNNSHVPASKGSSSATGDDACAQDSARGGNSSRVSGNYAPKAGNSVGAAGNYAPNNKSLSEIHPENPENRIERENRVGMFDTRETPEGKSETRVNRETPESMLSTRESPESIGQNRPATQDANQPEPVSVADRCDDARGRPVEHAAAPDAFALSGIGQALARIHPTASRTGMTAPEDDHSLSVAGPRQTGDCVLSGTAARVMDKDLPLAQNRPAEPEPGSGPSRSHSAARNAFALSGTHARVMDKGQALARNPAREPEPGSGLADQHAIARDAFALPDATARVMAKGWPLTANPTPEPAPDCRQPAHASGSGLPGQHSNARHACTLADAIERRIDDEYRAAHNLPPPPEPDFERPKYQPGPKPNAARSYRAASGVTSARAARDCPPITCEPGCNPGDPGVCAIWDGSGFRFVKASTLDRHGLCLAHQPGSSHPATRNARPGSVVDVAAHNLPAQRAPNCVQATHQASSSQSVARNADVLAQNLPAQLAPNRPVLAEPRPDCAHAAHQAGPSHPAARNADVLAQNLPAQLAPNRPVLAEPKPNCVQATHQASSSQSVARDVDTRQDACADIPAHNLPAQLAPAGQALAVPAPRLDIGREQPGAGPVDDGAALPNDDGPPHLAGDSPSHLAGEHDLATDLAEPAPAGQPAQDVQAHQSPSSRVASRSQPAPGHTTNRATAVPTPTHRAQSPPPAEETLRRPETDLQRLVTKLCHAKYLQDDMQTRLGNPVTASHGNQPSRTFPSPEEEWRSRPEWFAEYVELCARRIEEESCRPPSRSKLIQTIRRYDRYKTGWLDFKLHKQRIEPDPSVRYYAIGDGPIDGNALFDAMIAEESGCHVL